MKKILAIFLCLIFVCSLVSCDKKNEAPKPEKTQETTQNSTQEVSTEYKAPYGFISDKERLSWKNKIVTALSNANPYKEIEPGLLGAALMDLNFDNTPELIVVGAGGSMGNVCIVAYDLESGAKLCVLSPTPHYQEWNNAYFCVHRNNDGSYILVNKGSLRFELEWDQITSKLTADFKYDVLFEEVKAYDGSSRYYCGENEVDKAEFEKQKEQFKDDYKAVTETQLKIIYWDSIEFETKSEAISKMADSLVNSEQQFIRFDITPSTADKTEEQILADCEKAYLEFLKDKKESHCLFSLVYIDDDNIPELYLSGEYEAEGDMICSYKNGIVVYQYLSRIGGGKYIEKSGNIINQNGHMGLYYDNVYKLSENGFSQILSARYTERYEDIGNEEYNTYREYFIDNTHVSEADYNDAVSSTFDLSKAVSLYENAVSYDEVIHQLQSGNSAK